MAEPVQVGLATPGAILERARAVDRDVWTFDVELQAQRSRLPAPFVRGWEHWREAWRRFRTEREGWLPRLWPPVLAEVESFWRQLVGWRRAAERAGARFTAPPPAPPAAPSPLVRLPDLSSLLPSPLQVLGPMLGPAGHALGPEGPLSARFWESLKPVAIAGAVAVGGLALIWAASSARAALGQARSAERLLESGIPQALLTRGVVR